MSGSGVRRGHRLFNLLALLLLLTALIVSLGRVLLPLVAEYRTQAESRLTRLLGQPVQIARLSGHWPGLSPQLRAEDIHIGSAGAGIHIQRLELNVSLPGSLLRMQPHVARLQVEGVSLRLQEQADGRWQIAGLPLPAGGASDAPAALPAPDRLRGWIAELVLLDSNVELHTADGRQLRLQNIGLSLREQGAGWQLDSRLLLADGQPLALHADVQSAADWPQLAVSSYLHLPQADWLPWLQQRLPAAWPLAALSGGGELWLEWQGTRLESAALRLHLDQLAMPAAQLARPLLLEDLDVTAWLSRHGEDWRILLDDLGVDADGERIRPGRLQLDYQPALRRWSLQSEELELAPFSRLLAHLKPFPARAQEILDTLSPHGRIHDLQADLQLQDAGLPQLNYRMQLQQLGIAAWHGVPAIDNISGTLSGDLQSGELRLDSRDFLLHFPHLFNQPWRYREAQARLQWRRDNESFRLYSPLMRVSGDEGELAGNMLLRLHLDHAQPDELELQVGLRAGNAALAGRYLPSQAPGFSKPLDSWLRSAIGGGRIEQGLFLWHGSLSKDAPASDHEMALFFRVADVPLRYQQGWPLLEQVAGEIRVDGKGVQVAVPEARMRDARLSDLAVEVPLGGSASRLLVTGKVQAGLDTTLQVLQASPLAPRLPFAGWHGRGALEGQLRLGIPLSSRAAPQRIEVDFAARDASLHIADPALDISQLSGQFRYDTDHGLSARNLRGQLLGERVTGSASATGTPDAPATRLDLRGSVTVERLVQWLQGDPAQVPATGRLPYQLTLELGQGSRLRVDSDLLGTRIDLPEPFGKAASMPRATSWEMDLSGSERRYHLQHAGLAQLLYAAPAGQLEAGRGELRLGPVPASLPPGPGLRVRGELEQLNVDAWRRWWQAQPAGTGESPLRGALQNARLQIGQLQLGRLQLDAVSAGISPQGAGWLLTLDNARLAGRIAIPVSGILDVELQRLQLAENAAASTAGAADPLARLDPLSLPAMNVQVGEVWLGPQRLGSWKFRARPQGSVMRFDQLQLQLGGMTASGELDWGVQGSRVKGAISGEKLEAVLKNWGLAESMTSESFRIGLDGRWPGSPATIGLGSYSGRLDVQARAGQILEGADSARPLRIFGILNFDTLSRRMRLDFSDLLGKGLAYDRIEGQLEGVDGIFLTSQPLVLEGPSTRLELDGQLDMAADRIAAVLRVSLPLTGNLPLAALLVGAAPVAGALLVVDRLIGDQLSKVVNLSYRVDGPWQDPQISLWGDAPEVQP